MAKPKDVEYTKETIEEFLARGGRIQRIPYGVRSTDEDAAQRWGKRKPKAKPKSK